MSKRYLISFTSQYGSGSFDEFESLLRDCGHPNPSSVFSRYDANNVEIDLVKEPFLTVMLDPSIAEEVNRRSVTIRYMLELWGVGTNFHDAIHDAKHSVSSDVIANLTSAEKSWRVTNDTYGLRTPNNVGIPVVNHFFNICKPSGKVQLKNAVDVEYMIVFEYDWKKNSDAAANGPSKELTGKRGAASFDCCELKFSSELCENCTYCQEDSKYSNTRSVYVGVRLPPTKRGLVSELSLKTRSYLGPTSLDAELALLMCSLGLCKPGKVIWDPFLGTGSITVAAGKLGAYHFGSDIDLRVMNGKMGRSLHTNYEQYNLGIPEMLRLDSSSPAVRVNPSGFLDAIITDPPYGVRAGARKSGLSAEQKQRVEKRREVVMSRAETSLSTESCVSPDESGEHSGEVGESSGGRKGSFQRDEKSFDSASGPKGMGATQLYDCDDVMTDLLDTAARHLVVGGRLVYLLPSTPNVSTDDLPFHPLLRRVHVCTEKLTFVLVRLVVVMEKIAEYDPNCREEYLSESRKHSAEVGLRGGGVKERMGALLDSWFSMNQASVSDPETAAAVKKVLLKGTVSAENSAPQDASVSALERRHTVRPAPTVSLVGNSTQSKRSRKAEARLLFRQALRAERLRMSAEGTGGQSLPQKGKGKNSSRGTDRFDGELGSDGQPLSKRQRSRLLAIEAAKNGTLHISRVPFDDIGFDTQKLDEIIAKKKDESS